MKISALLLICVPLISGSNTNAAAQPNGEPMTTPTDTSIQLASDQTIGRIEPVFEFYDAMPTGGTVSAGGRIFINFPRWGDDVPFTVGEIRNGKVVAYPDAAINKFDPARPGETLSSVQSVVVDAANRLWILDTAAPSFSSPVTGGAKLVAVDLATNKVVKTIVLPPSVALSTTYLNDVRFDLRQGKAGIAYITDSAITGPGGIIVVDIDSGESWRKLNGHSSTAPDPAFTPVVEGEQLAIREKGKPPGAFCVASDGIALSDDGATLYYCPLSSRHLFSVPTALLRDRSASDDSVAKAVVDLGQKGASDGLQAMSAVSDGPRELQLTSQMITEIDSEGAKESSPRTPSAGPKPPQILVTIKDSGPGLDPERLDHLFDSFFSTKPQGVGIGLTISRSIIEAHSGRLWAEANAPRGAIFQSTLPI
jgi:sugar lactone lactonase YvrE